MENNWDNIFYLTWPIPSMISIYKKHHLLLMRCLRFFFPTKPSECGVHTTLGSDSQVPSRPLRLVAAILDGTGSPLTLIVWLSEVLPASAKCLGSQRTNNGQARWIDFSTCLVPTLHHVHSNSAVLPSHSLFASLMFPWIRPSLFLTWNTVTAPTCALYFTWGPLSHLPAVVSSLPEYLPTPWHLKIREWKS